MSKIVSVNKESFKGGCLLGHLTSTSDNLISILGEPLKSEMYKSDWSWIIQFDNGDQLEIYDWKVGKNYCGSRGLNLEDISEWNIGGCNKSLALTLKNLIEGKNWSAFDHIRKKIFFK